jgi:DNA-binding transcriptional ArsR family regulator
MDAVASAIADPTRRDILMLLRRRTMSAGEIAGRFDVSRPAISRHLRVLRESGLVVDDVRGRQRIYRLSLAPLEPLEAWLGEMRDVWSGPLDALETEVYRTRRERRARTDKTTSKERTA